MRALDLQQFAHIVVHADETRIQQIVAASKEEGNDRQLFFAEDALGLSIQLEAAGVVGFWEAADWRRTAGQAADGRERGLTPLGRRASFAQG